MDTQKLVSYQDSVNWMREQDKYSEFVELCYLDRDNLAAAKRFAASEEFQEVARLLQLKNRQQPVPVLDLGCGNGIASYSFASLGCQVTSVDPDISDDVGLMAAERLKDVVSNGSITTVEATAESLPFADNMFDIVYERQALHHFSNLVQGLTECVRVLKPSGVFLATREHVVDSPEQLDQFLAEHILHQLHGGENAYSVDHYVDSLKKAGFRVVKPIAPLENVINHFPASNLDIKNLFKDRMVSRFGESVGNLISQNSFAEKFFRQYASGNDKSPGRLYSFLCSK
jgi:ubiquinone/menaquinone biosynthesis C-methylase UbiE